MEPKTVYLDQNMWIYLSQAYYGLNKDPILKRICDKVISASDSGKFIFPFSVVHHIELSKHPNKQRKERLIDFIILVSKGYTIRPYTKDFKEKEITIAVFKKLEYVPKDAVLDAVQLGIENSFVRSSWIKERRSWIKENLLPGIREKIEKKIDELLRNPERIRITLKNTKDFKVHSDQNLLPKLEFLRRKENLSKDKMRKWQEAVAIGLAGIFPEIINVQKRFNIGKPLFNNYSVDTREEVVRFFESIPACYSVFALTYHRDIDLNKPIQENDLNDIFALAMAIGYCDIVVAENRFMDFAVRSK
ncbi:MAG: hypothetical protein WC595_06480, partial [Candidatus Nanoarchaeia archaeon]